MTTNDSKRLSAHHENPRLAAHEEEKLLGAHIDDSVAAAPLAADPVITNSARGNVSSAIKWGMAVMLALAVASAIAVVIGLRHHQTAVSDPAYASAYLTPGGNFLIHGSFDPQFSYSRNLETASVNTNAVRPANTSSAATTATAINPDGKSRLVAIADPTTKMIYLFDTGEAVIPENATLNEFARQISDTGRDVSVVAYTDPTGSRAGNEALSQKRAKALGDYLAAHGVSPQHIKIKGKGQTDAFGSYPLDRRAELHF